MKREFLKEMELTDEQIKTIMAENGKDVEGFKTQVTTLTTERDGLKTQLDEADKQIEEFGKMDVDGIKAAADEWKQKAEQAEADSAVKIAELQFNHALEGKLAGAKAKDASILLGLLKKDDLKLTDDGNILGLDEQLSKIKEEKDYLFEPEDGTPQIVKGTNNGAGIPAADSTLRAAMGLPPTTEK